jgi:hypothetical protein
MIPLRKPLHINTWKKNWGKRNMKRIILLLAILTASGVNAEEGQTPPAVQEQHRQITRQFVRGGIAETEAQELMAALVRARFTEEQLRRTGDLFLGEQQHGITGQAVRSKIHEGIAKKVPPDAIVAAAERVKNRLQYAEKLAAELPGDKTASLASTYADCLAAGLSEEHALRLTDAMKAKSSGSEKNEAQKLTTEILLTAREMVRRSISSATTCDVLQSALNNNYDSDGIRSLRQSLSGKSGDLESVAKHFGSAIDKGVHAGQLQGLGGAGSGEKSGMGDGKGDSGGANDNGGGSGGSGGGGGGRS